MRCLPPRLLPLHKSPQTSRKPSKKLSRFKGFALFFLGGEAFFIYEISLWDHL
jgi:hypothetical protein